MTLSGSCFWHNLWHSIWRIFWYSFWQLICYLTLGCASELAIERLWRGSNLVYKDWHVTWRWHADEEAGHRVIVVCCVCASFLIRRDVVKSRDSGKKQTISYYIYILNSRYPHSTSLHAEDRRRDDGSRPGRLRPAPGGTGTGRIATAAARGAGDVGELHREGAEGNPKGAVNEVNRQFANWKITMFSYK